MLTYDHYRIFYYVAIHRSFTKAAKILNNSQPNIMRYINNMEADLDCKLFERSNRGVTLTFAGEKLFKRVRIAFEQLEKGEEELRKEKFLQSGSINIGVSEIGLRLSLLPVLESFCSKYPDINIYITNDSTPDALKNLETGITDFALVTSPLSIAPPLNAIKIGEFKEIPVAGNRFRELEHKVCSLEELSSYPIVSLKKGSGTRQLYTEYFMEHGLEFDPAMLCATSDQLLPMIEHNLGIGFCPYGMAENSIANGSVFQIKMKEKLPERGVFIVTNEERQASTATNRIIEEIVSNKLR